MLKRSGACATIVAAVSGGGAVPEDPLFETHVERLLNDKPK
jgi:hypothetical protein